MSQTTIFLVILIVLTVGTFGIVYFLLPNNSSSKKNTSSSTLTSNLPNSTNTNTTTTSSSTTTTTNTTSSTTPTSSTTTNTNNSSYLTNGTYYITFNGGGNTIYYVIPEVVAGTSTNCLFYSTSPPAGKFNFVLISGQTNIYQINYVGDASSPANNYYLDSSDQYCLKPTFSSATGEIILNKVDATNYTLVANNNQSLSFQGYNYYFFFYSGPALNLQIIPA